MAADKVGLSFINTYYNRLVDDLDALPALYGSHSQFFHTSASPAVGGVAIREQLNALYGGKDVVLNIADAHVDCQSTRNGEIVITVTGGRLSVNGDDDAPFMQVFYLARQDASWYLHNDMLCVLEAPPRAAAKPIAPPVANGTSVPPPAAEPAPPAPAAVKVAVAAPPVPAPAPAPAPAPVVAPVSKPAAPAPAAVASAPKPKPAPKPAAPKPKITSYLGAALLPASAPPPRPVAAKPEPAAESDGGAGAEEDVPTPAAARPPQRKPRDPSAPTTSIFVRGMKPEVEDDALQAAFSQFGTVNGMHLASKDRGYIHVHFNTRAECEAAMKAGSVVVGTVTLQIQEKRDAPPGGRGRGRGSREAGEGRGGDRGARGRGGPRRPREDRRGDRRNSGPRHDNTRRTGSRPKE